jgi:hypothetical protein
MDPKHLQGLMEAYSEVYAPIDENRMASRMEKMPSAPAKVGKATHSIKDISPSKPPTPEEKAKARKALGLGEKVDLFDTVLEFLQVEGYAETLEEAEWLMANVIDEEAIDIILGEEQLDEISLKTKMKAYSASRDVDADYNYGSKVHDQGDRIKKAIVKKHGEKAGEHAERAAEVQNFGRGTPRAKPRIEKNRTYRTTKAGSMHGQDQAKLKSDLKKRRNEEYMDEAQVANRDPDKYEAGQQKKYAPVRGEKTPMPPRGDKRREDFEKWYAANVR